jgi:hypothetical protein
MGAAVAVVLAEIAKVRARSAESTVRIDTLLFLHVIE